jgi:hypothetical protein
VALLCYEYARADSSIYDPLSASTVNQTGTIVTGFVLAVAPPLIPSGVAGREGVVALLERVGMGMA